VYANCGGHQDDATSELGSMAEGLGMVGEVAEHSYMLQTSTSLPYALPASSSGALYAGDPHCVLSCRTPAHDVLRPKSISFRLRSASSRRFST